MPLVSLWHYRLLGLPASSWSGSSVGVGGRPAIGRQAAYERRAARSRARRSKGGTMPRKASLDGRLGPGGLSTVTEGQRE
jgi:hypothetical protein